MNPRDVIEACANELDPGGKHRIARLTAERDRYKAALETIAKRDCWNAHETAEFALRFKP
jgi:hypothetical protein